VQLKLKEFSCHIETGLPQFQPIRRILETILMTYIWSGTLTQQQGCLQGLHNELICGVDHVDFVGVLVPPVDLDVYIIVMMDRKKCCENSRLA
jgi:hypothetical protein